MTTEPYVALGGGYVLPAAEYDAAEQERRRSHAHENTTAGFVEAEARRRARMVELRAALADTAP